MTTDHDARVSATVDGAALDGRRGRQLLRNPRWNKSTAFTTHEREPLGLVGLLPEGVEDEARQVQRVVRQLGQAPSALAKSVSLNHLHDRNETLFYRVLMSDPEVYLPIVYLDAH
jgi:malate dehydrogenase (oxaloacetate-decarboxylating)(NADP+)